MRKHAAVLSAYSFDWLDTYIELVIPRPSQSKPMHADWLFFPCHPLSFSFSLLLDTLFYICKPVAFSFSVWLPHSLRCLLDVTECTHTGFRRGTQTISKTSKFEILLRSMRMCLCVRRSPLPQALFFRFLFVSCSFIFVFVSFSELSCFFFYFSCSFVNEESCQVLAVSAPSLGAFLFFFYLLKQISYLSSHIYGKRYSCTRSVFQFLKQNEQANWRSTHLSIYLYIYIYIYIYICIHLYVLLASRDKRSEVKYTHTHTWRCTFLHTCMRVLSSWWLAPLFFFLILVILFFLELVFFLSFLTLSTVIQTLRHLPLSLLLLFSFFFFMPCRRS